MRGSARAVRGTNRWWVTLVAVLLLALGLAACGEDEVAEEPEEVAVEEPEPEEAEPVEDPVDADLGPQWTQPLDAEFWYGGFRVELAEAELVYEEEWDEVVAQLVVHGMFENLTDDTAGQFHYEIDEMILHWDGDQAIAGRDSELEDVPAGGTNRGRFAFEVPLEFELDGAVLHAGSPAKQHAIIPLDGEGEVVTLEPAELDITGTGSVEGVEVEVTGAELRAFCHRYDRQLDAGDLSLAVTYDVGYEGERRSIHVGSDLFVLETPDGRSLTPEMGPNLAFTQGEWEYDEIVSFIVADPPEGDYILTIVEGDEEVTFEFTI